MVDPKPSRNKLHAVLDINVVVSSITNQKRIIYLVQYRMLIKLSHYINLHFKQGKNKFKKCYVNDLEIDIRRKDVLSAILHPTTHGNEFLTDTKYISKRSAGEICK